MEYLNVNENMIININEKKFVSSYQISTLKNESKYLSKYSQNITYSNEIKNKYSTYNSPYDKRHSFLKLECDFLR